MEFAICPNRRDIPLRGAICAAARGNLYHIAADGYLAFAEQIYRVAKQHIAKGESEDICNFAVSLLCEEASLIVEGSSCKVIDNATPAQLVGTN